MINKYWQRNSQLLKLNAILSFWKNTKQQSWTDSAAPKQWSIKVSSIQRLVTGDTDYRFPDLTNTQSYQRNEKHIKEINKQLTIINNLFTVSATFINADNSEVFALHRKKTNYDYMTATFSCFQFVCYMSYIPKLHTTGDFYRFCARKRIIRLSDADGCLRLKN
jgi:hypothetical protein